VSTAFFKRRGLFLFFIIMTLTIIGLGPGATDVLPARAFQALTAATPDAPLLLRTARHPILESGPLAEALQQLPTGAVCPLDHFYETSASFEETYSNIVAEVLAQVQSHHHISYAVPGHPLVGESTVALLIPEAKRRGIVVQVIGAPSFVDATLEALQEAIISDLYVLDALLLDPTDPAPPAALRTGQPLLFYQVHSPLVASQTKLALMGAGYPDEFRVTLVRAAGMPEREHIKSVPLYLLDRKEHAHDHLTSLWVPAIAPSDRIGADMDDLVRIMARLRDPKNGCPWDLKQTHLTLRKYLLEEAYEVAEAIDSADPDALCDELGDLLLQVVFHAQLATEVGDFTVRDVCEAIVSKMIRRHPHIFGDTVAETSEEVLSNWNAIKQLEKQGKGIVEASSVLSGVSSSLPALLQALEVSKKAVKVGFEWPETLLVLDKVEEEWRELRCEIEIAVENKKDNKERVSAELGDVFFTLVNLARKFDIDPEEALRKQIARFSGRFYHIETQAKYQSRALESLTLAEWETYWQEAKRAEKSA
jgi:tetrapyrrole methylase family protein / MazG family protein